MLKFSEPISEEMLQKLQEHFATLPCSFGIVIREESCDERPFKEAYFGSCPWCKEEIYTIDVCPDCGKLIDIH